MIAYSFKSRKPTGVKMTVLGMDRISICVSSLQKSLPFYRDLIGLSVIREYVPSSILVEKIHGVAAKTAARACLLKNELQDTLLELIEFTPAGGKPVRFGPGALEHGLYDFAFFVKDIQTCYAEGLAKGYKFASEPIPYQPNWVPHKVWEVIMFGPDNTPVVLFQRETGEAQAYQRQYIRLNHSAQIVESIDEVKKFYGGVLGLDAKGDMRVPGGVVDRVMGYPPGTEARLAFYERKGTNSCLLEFIEAKYQARTLGREGRPPNYGIFMISFEDHDLESTLRKSELAGFPTSGQPVSYRDIRNGTVTAASINAPSGVLVHLFKKGK